MCDQIEVAGSRFAVTTSIGIAFSREVIPNADALMQLADTALYAAKAAGRNTFRVAE
jgi:diguanylate cyclase (GGDEF)-like protein